MLIHKLLAPDELGGGAGGGSNAPAGGGVSAPNGGEGGSAAPSIEDTARSAYRELMAGDDSDGGDEIPDQEPPHKNQPRDKGRFAKTNGEPALPNDQNKDPAQPAKPGESTSAAPESVQPTPQDTYPNTWRKELSGKWATLDPEVRAEIHKRESDFHNGLKQYKDAAGFGVTLAREMQPYHEIMQRMNVTPQAVVRDIMGSLKTLATGSEESKAAEFLKLASNYGINWDTLATLRQRAPQGADPNLQPVIQRMQQIETRITQADQEREQHLRERDEATVQSFLNDPKNEHAQAVRNEMAALLKSGEASTMQEAYEKAIWLNPTVRAKLLEKQEVERRTKEAEQVAAAKKAAAANVTKRGTPPTPQSPKTIEDSARAVYRRLMPS